MIDFVDHYYSFSQQENINKYGEEAYHFIAIFFCYFASERRSLMLSLFTYTFYFYLFTLIPFNVCYCNLLQSRCIFFYCNTFFLLISYQSPLLQLNLMLEFNIGLCCVKTNFKLVVCFFSIIFFYDIVF